MICTHYQNGQKLDVAGLNVVTVLVDRSETQLTEVGWNSWRKGLEGPPHSHAAKEQSFYVTDGQGTIVVGTVRYAVGPGSLIYVPPSVIHQTIVTGDAPLSYLLFNAFLDASKEGHVSFADHINEVRQVRLKQAQTRRADVMGAEPGSISGRPGKHLEDVHAGRASDVGTNTSTLLLDRNETHRCEVMLVTWAKCNEGTIVAHEEKEQTFLVLSGRGRVTIANETSAIGVGDVIFVPWNTPHTIAASGMGLSCLRFNTLVANHLCLSSDRRTASYQPDLVRNAGQKVLDLPGVDGPCCGS
jgi:mannose-6-phosphate isomerase-like protein (cupin superfamily)